MKKRYFVTWDGTQNECPAFGNLTIWAGSAEEAAEKAEQILDSDPCFMDLGAVWVSDVSEWAPEEPKYISADEIIGEV